MTLLGLWFLGAVGAMVLDGIRPKDWLGVIRAFFVLHVSYGWGYWQGIWDFLPWQIAFGGVQDVDPMSRLPLDRMEAWAWRMVMPALLWGGTATASVLTLATVFRVWQWRRDRPSRVGRCRDGMALVGVLRASDSRWPLEPQHRGLGVQLGSQGGFVFCPCWRAFWAILIHRFLVVCRLGVLAFLVWRVGVATGQWMLHGDVGGWRYAGFSGDVHPTYLSLHAVVAWLGVGRRWGMRRWCGRSPCWWPSVWG